MKDLSKIASVAGRCALVVGISCATLSLVACGDDTAAGQDGSDSGGNPTAAQTASSSSTGSGTGTGSTGSATTATGTGMTDTFDPGTDADDATGSSGDTSGGDTATDTDANAVPVADDSEVSTPAGETVAVTLVAADADGDPLTYQIVQSPANGTLQGDAPNLAYVPNAGYVGPDSFTWTASDAQGASNVATVSIEVTVVGDNTPPVADSMTVQVVAGNSAMIGLTGSDDDGDGISFEVVTQPQFGTLGGEVPNLTYTPDDGYEGTDSFQYKANDGEADSELATVTLNIVSSNNPPRALDQARDIDYEKTTTLILTALDRDRDGLVYRIVDYPEHGQVRDPISNPNLLADAIYTPDRSFRGVDSFTFVANDGEVDSQPATVSLRVGGTNHEPVAQDLVSEIGTALPLAVTLAATDADADDLTYRLALAPRHGTVNVSAGVATYTSDAGYIGDDVFYYQANDGEFDSNLAKVKIVVGGDNHRPLAQDAEYTYRPGDRLVITLMGSDPDGDEITYRLLNSPHVGMLTGELPTLEFRTVAGVANGFTSFQFNTNDGQANSRPATVKINIQL